MRLIAEKLELGTKGERLHSISLAHAMGWIGFFRMGWRADQYRLPGPRGGQKVLLLERFEKLFRGHPGLPEDTGQGTNLDFLVIRHDTPESSSAVDLMTATLPQEIEPKLCKDPTYLDAGKVGELRHERERRRR